MWYPGSGLVSVVRWGVPTTPCLRPIDFMVLMQKHKKITAKNGPNKNDQLQNPLSSPYCRRRRVMRMGAQGA